MSISYEHFIRAFHASISYEHFMRAFHMSISYEHFIRAFHASISYKHFIWAFHTSISCEHFIWAFHTSISCEHFIRAFHASISYEHFIWAFHMSISYEHFIRAFHTSNSCEHFIWAFHASISFSFHLVAKPVTEIISEKPLVIDVVLQADTASTSTTQTRPTNTITLNNALSSIFVFGCIMLYYFLCDYMHYFPKADRTYNRDLFVFLCILLFVVAVFFTSAETPEGKFLNREQTEEWRGWMQVMFVWYHYFKAAETYNAVRIYIAAYVWMTGFGMYFSTGL